jgi:NCS2 family nucleobase:cation symporter-2
MNQRRTRFILTAAMCVGIGATLVPTWFSYVFTYSGSNQALLGFLDAITLVMETGFAVTAFLALFLNLVIPEEIVDEPEAPELTANTIDEPRDEEEWDEIKAGHHGKSVSEPAGSGELGRNGVGAQAPATELHEVGPVVPPMEKA